MGIYVKAIRNFETETQRKKGPAGGSDTKNRQNSKNKSRKSKQNSQFDNLMKKRQMDLDNQDIPLTFNLGDIYNINSTKGFITHKSLGNIERR